MLRVDLLGLARAHAEGGGIEAPDVVDNAGSEGVAAAELVWRRMIIGLSGEAIRRYPGYAASVVPEEMPQLVALPSPRHATRIANDRDFAS